jgi:hypothetical protein
MNAIVQGMDLTAQPLPAFKSSGTVRFIVSLVIGKPFFGFF